MSWGRSKQAPFTVSKVTCCSPRVTLPLWKLFSLLHLPPACFEPVPSVLVHYQSRLLITLPHLYCLLLTAQSCLILCNSVDCSPPGSSVHGILQARILEWVAIPFFRGSSRPRDLYLGLLHCRQVLYHLSHQGSPIAPIFQPQFYF